MRKNYLLFFLVAMLTFNANAQYNIFTDNYEPGITFVDFGGSTNILSIDATQAHSGTSSLKAEVTTGYTGGAFSNSTIKNLSAYNCVSFWVKASAAKTLNVAGLCNNGISAVWQTEYNNIPVTTTWTKVIIPIPNPAKDTAETGMFHFAEGSDEGTYTLWFDDIKYEQLNSSIIGAPTASFGTATISNFVGDIFYPFGATCSFPVNGIPQNLNIVNRWLTFISSNNTVARVDGTATGTAKSVGTAVITAKLGPAVVASGSLTVNVSAAIVPATAAPTPTASAANVISLFSNPYTNVAVDTWSAGWDAADVSDLQIAGNDTKKYTNLNYSGIEFTSSTIDATMMDNFHVDIWTPDATTFSVKLVDFGADGMYGGGDDTESQIDSFPVHNSWLSYNIPLNSFANLASRSHLAQMLFISSNSTVFFDNVYFYKTAACCAAPTGLKVPAGGITATTAKPKWQASTCGLGLSYQLQYKPVSSGTWTTVTVPALTKKLNGLTAATTYQWQVATVCQASPLILSAYKTGPNFTTLTAAQNAIADNKDIKIHGVFSASIFPNPAKSSSLLRINNATAVSITITDLTGKMLWQSLNVKEQQVNIPVEKFAPGIYLVAVTSGKENKVLKLVKE